MNASVQAGRVTEWRLIRARTGERMNLPLWPSRIRRLLTFPELSNQAPEDRHGQLGNAIGITPGWQLKRSGLPYVEVDDIVVRKSGAANEQGEK